MTKPASVRFGWLVVGFLMLLTVPQWGCSHVSNLKNAVTGDGIGEVTPIGNGQFDIVASGSFSGNRGDTYAKWERTAKAACNGGGYKTIKREWQSAEYPGILGGIVECAGKKK